MRTVGLAVALLAGCATAPPSPPAPPPAPAVAPAPELFEPCHASHSSGGSLLFECGDLLATFVESEDVGPEALIKGQLLGFEEGSGMSAATRAVTLELGGTKHPGQALRLGEAFEGYALGVDHGAGSRTALCMVRLGGVHPLSRCRDVIEQLVVLGPPDWITPEEAPPPPDRPRIGERDLTVPEGCRVASLTHDSGQLACDDGSAFGWALVDMSAARAPQLMDAILVGMRDSVSVPVQVFDHRCWVDGSPAAACRRVAIAVAEGVTVQGLVAIAALGDTAVTVTCMSPQADPAAHPVCNGLLTGDVP